MVLFFANVKFLLRGWTLFREVEPCLLEIEVFRLVFRRDHSSWFWVLGGFVND